MPFQRFFLLLATGLVGSLALASCLDDPELRSCEEFPLAERGESCEINCIGYCQSILEVCPNAYPTVDNCEASCLLLPEGTVGVDENSIACRIRYVGEALVEPSDLNCNAASFWGGGICGEVCPLYCDLVQQNCTGSDQVYPDRRTCLTTCDVLNAAGRFDDWVFTAEVDSVQCRLYHAGPPAVQSPQLHCPHTRVYNDEHCGIDPSLNPQPDDWPCRTFCKLMERNCATVYASTTECLTACSAFPEVMNLTPGQEPNIYPITSTVCPTR